MATLPYTGVIQFNNRMEVSCHGFVAPDDELDDGEWVSWGQLNPRKSKRHHRYSKHKIEQNKRYREIIVKYGNEQELNRMEQGDDMFLPIKYCEERQRIRWEDRQFQLEKNGYYFSDGREFTFNPHANKYKTINIGFRFSGITDALKAFNKMYPSNGKLEYDLDVDSDTEISYNSAKLEGKYCRIISKYRNELGMTMSEAAKKINITEAEYKHYESAEGILCPDQDVINSIRSLFNITENLTITKPKNL